MKLRLEERKESNYAVILGLVEVHSKEIMKRRASVRDDIGLKKIQKYIFNKILSIKQFFFFGKVFFSKTSKKC